jgi:hypothetical protein
MASHPKPSAKNAQGDARLIFKPSAEVAAKMAPLAKASFRDLLKRAAQPTQRRASKISLISPVVPIAVLIQVALQILLRNLMVHPADSSFH